MRFFFLVLLLSTINLFSQQKGGVYKDNSMEVQEEITYKVVSKFPVNILHGYTLNIISDVVRTYSDESKYFYNRNVNYDISLKAVDMPKEGKQFIYVMVDSMNYEFKDAKGIDIKYNSMDFNATPPLKHIDYENHAIPLGLEWEMVYSPYYDVIDITGKKIDYKRDYINDSKLGIKDSIKLFRWNQGLSNEYLNFIADVHKGLIPDSRVSEDTTWADFVFFNLEGIKFRDSVEVHFDEYTVANYILKASSKEILPADEKVILIGIDKEFCEVLEVKGNADYVLKINPYGTLNEMLINYDIEAKIKINKEVFTQNIKTTLSWTLNGMWKW